MTVHVTKRPNGILLQMLAEGPGGRGDLTTLVKPGETKLGKPYEFWADLGDGEHTIEEGD